MTKKDITPQAVPIKLYTSIGLAVLSFNVLLHLFMVYVVFASKEASISLYIPAKGGGNTYFVNINEFLIASYSAIAISAIAVAAVVLLIRAKKIKAAMYTLVTLLFFALQYAAIYAGNAVDEVWGGTWSILAVAFILIGSIYAIFVLVNTSTKTVERK